MTYLNWQPFAARSAGRELALLRRIAKGRPAFGNRNVRDPKEGSRFDAEVEELRDLERKGLIRLVLAENHLTRHGHWYAAVPKLTAEGRKCLEDSAEVRK